MQERLSKLAEYLGRLDPLKSLFWAIVVATAVATNAFAGIQNHLGNLDDSNGLRKVEIGKLDNRVTEMQKDREQNIKDARIWREQTAKQLGRIEGMLEDHWGHS